MIWQPTRHHSISRPPPSRTIAILLVGWLTIGALAAGPLPATAATGDRVAPLPGQVLRGFKIGAADWEPGHRGVDLAGTTGAAVVAAAAGEVAWVGVIAGVPMLSIQHPDGLRTTYQPVLASVVVGVPVRAGEPIGLLAAGHCAADACLHWGLREGERYLDPMVWLAEGSAAEIRLLPRDALPRALPQPGADEAANSEPALIGGLPVAGPITSPFGSRINPISGTAEFHDGIDIGAACGLPVQTLWPGVVRFVGGAGGYGLRVEVEHGQGRATSYSHLSGFNVTAGQQLAAGAVLGLVGTTGYSTGCHLHYSLTVGGQSVDPLGGG